MLADVLGWQTPRTCGLLAQLDAVCPGGLQAPAGGSLQVALVDPDTGALRAAVSRTEFERLARRGCPRHPTGRRGDMSTGESMSCSCPVLDRPPPVGRYTPTPAQRRFITRRDGTCRHPGCARRPDGIDADHVTAYAAGGPTACENLCWLCGDTTG